MMAREQPAPLSARRKKPEPTGKIGQMPQQQANNHGGLLNNVGNYQYALEAPKDFSHHHSHMLNADLNGQIGFKDAGYVKPKYESSNMRDAMFLNEEINM